MTKDQAQALQPGDEVALIDDDGEPRVIRITELVLLWDEFPDDPVVYVIDASGEWWQRLASELA